MLRSARSGLRAAVVARVYEHADVCPLYTSVPLQYTLNKTSLLLTPRLISISSPLPFLERRRGAKIPTLVTPTKSH